MSAWFKQRQKKRRIAAMRAKARARRQSGLPRCARNDGFGMVFNGDPRAVADFIDTFNENFQVIYQAALRRLRKKLREPGSLAVSARGPVFSNRCRAAS